MLTSFIFLLLALDVDSFKISTPRIFRNSMKRFNSMNSYDFKYAKEYYDFLLDYDIIPKNRLLTEQNSSKYEIFCKKRLDNYKIFEKNLANINEFNQNSSFLLGINQFADTYDYNDLMENQLINSKDIIKNDFLGIVQILKNPNEYLIKYNNISNSLIWDDKILPKVKNQGRCGSCWAFSTTGSIEGLMRINKYDVSRLSEQELVDCSNNNYGCGGGLMHLAMDYIIDNNGLTSNDNYPYTATDNECKLSCNDTGNLTIFDKVKGSKIKDYRFTIPRSIIDIKTSLKHGPISIALDASPFAFRFYKSGIIDIPNTNSSQINHAVLLTGYDTDVNGTYWIIQNSWGETWGDNGYAKIRVRNGDGVLMCQLYGVYPNY